MMEKIVLMVVDVQNALIKEHPYNEDRVIENIKKLILAARSNTKEVIYVRHNDDNDPDFTMGTEGWQIYKDIEPEKDEKIFEKQYNSAFHKTELRAYLKEKEVDAIILVGLQTEYCIDATCKSAFDYGYKVIIPEETNTTFNNDYLTGDKLYEFYNKNIWDNRFAKVLPLTEVINLMQYN